MVNLLKNIYNILTRTSPEFRFFYLSGKGFFHNVPDKIWMQKA